MELRHLRYFVAVAEALNFTRAAEHLHIGQPPLSMQIRDLEEEIGAQLLERTRRRVALTEAGRCFLVRAREILAQAELAGAEARRAALGELGELRVAFTASLPYTSILPDMLYAYRQRYPDVRLQLREMFTGEQIAALLRDELDLGLVRFDGLDASPEIALREIGRDPLRLVVNSAHPLAGAERVTFAECRDERFITFPADAGTGLPTILNRLCHRAGFEPNIVQTAREVTTQIGLVAAGIGVALLPAPLECVRIPRVRFLPVDDRDAHLSLAVATRDRTPSPLLAGLLAVIDSVRPDAGEAS